MTITQHLAIRRALVDLLKVEPAVAGGRVYGGRARPIGSDVESAVVVRLLRSASQLAGTLGGRTSWTTLIAIECYGRSAAGAPDEAADPVVAAVFERLESDPTLGNLVMDTEPLEGDTLAWESDELDLNVACITARFVVRHQTLGRTLT